MITNVLPPVYLSVMACYSL